MMFYLWLIYDFVWVFNEFLTAYPIFLDHPVCPYVLGIKPITFAIVLTKDEDKSVSATMPVEMPCSIPTRSAV